MNQDSTCIQHQEKDGLLLDLLQKQRTECVAPGSNDTGEEVIVEWMEGNLFPYCRREFGNSPVVIVMDNAQLEVVTASRKRFLTVLKQTQLREYSAKQSHMWQGECVQMVMDS